MWGENLIVNTRSRVPSYQDESTVVTEFIKDKFDWSRFIYISILVCGIIFFSETFGEAQAQRKMSDKRFFCLSGDKPRCFQLVEVTSGGK